MTTIVRAIVLTNSSEDKYARVKIKSPKLWTETPLIESVGGISLKKDDEVFVDISDGIVNPLILGRCTGSNIQYSENVNGSLLFESSDGSNYTIAFVKNNKLEIYNSGGTSLVCDASKIEIKSDKISINSDVTVEGGSFKMNGVVTPDPKGGPFCALKTCLFTGAPHATSEVKNIY